MTKYKGKLRKPRFQSTGAESSISLALREIGKDISQRKMATGLSKVDKQLAAPGLNPNDQSRLLAMVADGEFASGRFEKAAEIHLQVATNCSGHHELWLRPLVGHVRALLKVPRVDQALIMARHAVAMAEAKMGDFDKQVCSANRVVLGRKTVLAPLLPPRVSVVATRMAYLFMQEGEPEIAQEFFERAAKASPGGANRAKQGLAKIAMARGNHKKALELSAEAIRQGKYRAKTLPAWRTLISARRQLGGWTISERLIKGLDAAPAELRARTILTIAVEMRKNDMRQWREVAERWSQREGAQFPIIEAEIRKLFLSSAKAEPGAAPEKRCAAESLLKTPGLSPMEWLMAAKESVRSGLFCGQTPDVEALILSAKAGYGPEFAPVVAHGLALSCLLAKRRDLARPLFMSNIQGSKAGCSLWAKSVWALARMENAQGNHVAAADLYQRFFEQESIAIRFRLQAQLLWVEALIAAGRPEALLEARPRMSALLATVEDPDILMNFARQLRMGPAELREISLGLFAQGEALSVKRFNEAANPDAAVFVLFKLARRQVIDFDRGRETLLLWESFTPEKRDWLWSESALFWEYMGLVYEAYAREGQATFSDQFARGLLEDPATPAQGAPYVGIPFARRKMAAGKSTESLALFARLARTAPSHALCAWAWYWLALDARRRNDAAKSKEYARNIRAAQGVPLGMLNEWHLDARALLLLADLDPARIDVQAVNYDAPLLEEQMKQISTDLARLAR